jgi:hypothetical protein
VSDYRLFSFSFGPKFSSHLWDFNYFRILSNGFVYQLNQIILITVLLFWTKVQNLFLLLGRNIKVIRTKANRPPIFRWNNQTFIYYSYCESYYYNITTGTGFIQKIYAPSSSLLQGKHLPFSPSPLRLNIFRLFVILSLIQLYRYTPEIFLFRLPHLNINTGPPSDELDKNIQRKSHFLFFSQWNGYQTNWTRIFSESLIFYFSVNETDTTTSGLRWSGSRKEKYFGSVTI